MSARDTGVRAVRAGLAAVAVFVLGAGGYLVWAALTNPDVRLRQPKWIESGFDHSYWIPVLVVTLGGAALVGLVLWTAYRRLRAGEDLFEGRMGRGERRRGERYSDE